jgi:protein-disulfide isomerase
MRRRGEAGVGFALAAAVLALLSAVCFAQESQRISPAGMTAILAKPWRTNVGAVEPDAVIVEYFDYNCGFCKRFAPTLQSVLAGDRKLAVLYKDWPILGAVSVYASQSALATQWQGKYEIAHDALLKSPHLTSNAQVDAILQTAGVDMARLQSDRVAHAADIAAVLTRNAGEADALELQGTPGIVVGRELIAGITDAPNLRHFVDIARHDRGK